MPCTKPSTTGRPGHPPHTRRPDPRAPTRRDWLAQVVAGPALALGSLGRSGLGRGTLVTPGTLGGLGLGSLGTARAATPASADTVEGAGRQAAAVTVSDQDWHDAARDRRIPVRIRRPAADRPAPAGGWPVLLFSHGLGGTRDGGAVFGQAWAEAGFVVLHLQHPGSDWPALAGGPPEARAAGEGEAAPGNGPAPGLAPGLVPGLARRLQAAMQPAQLLARIADVRFALDELARRGLGRPDRVGLAGHSFGAHTTLAMAGQAWPGFAGVQEPRLAAFIALSPLAPKPQPGLAPAEALAGIRRPMLLATGSLDGEVVGNGATPEARRQVFELLPPGHKALLWLDQADHMSFAGQTGRAVEALRPRSEATRRAQPQHHTLIAQAGTDWFRAHLLDDAAAAARLRQPPAGAGPEDRWLTG